MINVTEKEIENQILEYLLYLPGAKFWKVDTVGVFDPTKKVFRLKRSKFRHKGISDIIGFYYGKFVAFEVKTHKRRSCATDEQKEFIEAANENNQSASVVTSLEDVLIKLIEIREAA